MRSAQVNRRQAESNRARLAAELRALVADYGPRICLDCLDRSTPWEASVVGHPGRVVKRSSMRYWSEQGWATRGDARDSRFVLEVEVEMLPVEGG
jgi:hypothetical protein